MGLFSELLRRSGDAASTSPAPRSARRVPPATADRSEAFTNTALDILRDENGRPVLDPVTGRPVLQGDGPQPTSPDFTEENFDLDEAGTPVPMEKPDARLAVLEAIGLALRGMDTGAPGPVVRNNALADLIAERQALRAQEVSSLPPPQNVVTSDSKGLSPSSEIPATPASTVDFESGRRGASLGEETLSEEPFEQLIPVAVDGPLERQYVPALDEFGNVKLDSAGNPIPSVTVDRWDPELGAYVTTAPGPPTPVSEAPVFEQTITGETYQRTDPTTGRGQTVPAYENLPGQVVRRGPPSYYAGRLVEGPGGSSRIEVDQTKPVIVLERSRSGSDGNRSAESRVFLTRRGDGGYQVMTLGDDGSPSYLRATDFDVQRLLAQGFEPVHGSLDVARPTMPESPEALARAIVETRAGTVNDGQSYRVGVDSPEAKADIIAQVDQLRKFGNVEDLRRFFEELGSAGVQLDDVGAGADNAVARGQMAYKAFLDAGVQPMPAPRARQQLSPNAVREERIRRLVSPNEQVVSAPGAAQSDIVTPSGAPASGIQVDAAGPQAGFSEALSGSTATPESFAVPEVSASTTLDVLSGLNRINPAMLDAGFSPTTAGAGMMDFTITPEGSATLRSSALDELLGQLNAASTQAADVGSGSLRSAETFYPRLPDTFYNQFATASGDVSGAPMPAAPRERPLWTRSRGIWDQPLADRVKAARQRRETGLSMPTPSAFDDMLRGMQPAIDAAPAEENVRQAVEQILRGNANRRVSEQGRVVESASPTVLGPETAVRSRARDRFSTMVDSGEEALTEKVLRGAESVMPQEAGISRSDLRAMAMEGMIADPSLSQFVDGARPPLAFKEVEMRSSSARPGAASLEKIAERQAQIDALRETVETDYPDPAAIRSRLAEISETLSSGEASGSRREFTKVGTEKTGMERSERAELRAERARLKERLADSESPSYMQARESALAEIARLEESSAAADDKFGMSNANSVGDAQQAILNKLLLPSQSFNEEEFLQAAEQMFGVTTRAGDIDSGRVFDAIRAAAERRGMARPSDSDIVFAALSDLQRPVRELSGKVHTIGPRGLRSVADYISRGLDARRSGQQYGPDAPLLRPGQADRPKSAWEAINEQFERVAGPMIDQPQPAPALPAVYDQFIPPFLRLPATLDDIDTAFRGMTIEETQRALEQLSAAESAARSVPLPPTQDPARLAEIIATAREAGRRRLGNVPAASRRPDTLTAADTQSLDLESLERDVGEWRQSIAQLEADPARYPQTRDSRGRPIGDHPEVAAAKRELSDAEERLAAARSQASATAQPMEFSAPGAASGDVRARLITLAGRRASLQRTAIAAEASSQGDVIERVQQELGAVDAEIDALISGQAGAALTPPRVERAPAQPARLPASMYAAPSPVTLGSADDLRDAVRLAPDSISYAFVVPKETAQALRSRVNPELARMKITRETGPDEVALSGLIGGGEIEGGIRFTNPSDLSRLPTDGSVEVLHLDKDGRPTFYDPAGMDLRNPTARELEEIVAAEAADTRSASRMNRAAEDQAIAVSSRPPVPAARQAAAAPVEEVVPPAARDASERPVFDQNNVGNSGMDRTGQSPRAARLARAAQNSQSRSEVAAGQRFEAESNAAAAEARRVQAEADAAADIARRRQAEAEAPSDGAEAPAAGRSGAVKRGAIGLGGAALLGFGGKVGLDYLAGDEVQAAPILASTLVAEPASGDTNSSAESVLDRIRQARQYQSYLVSGNMMPR